jgi:hypothetical protein
LDYPAAGAPLGSFPLGAFSCCGEIRSSAFKM